MIEIGLGLWSMQSTAFVPASWTQQYGRLADEARFVEALGYDGMWFAEHHFWYDGWCPQPVIAASVAAAATTRLRVGTAMHLLPLHQPEQVAALTGRLAERSAGRLDLGVGLGYRDAEFEGMGLTMRRRGRLMEANLDVVRAGWMRSAVVAPRVFVGGMAPRAIERAARRGLGLMLPPSLRPHEAARVIADAREIADGNGTALGPVGMMVDTWIESPGTVAFFAPRMRAHYKEYAGAWWQIKGRPGFAVPELLDRQMDRSVAAMVVGSAAEVLDRLGALADAGVEVFGLQIQADVTTDHWRAMAEQLATSVVPDLRTVVA